MFLVAYIVYQVQMYKFYKNIITITSNLLQDNVIVKSKLFALKWYTAIEIWLEKLHGDKEIFVTM